MSALAFLAGVVVGAVVFGLVMGPRTGDCCAALQNRVSDKIGSTFGAGAQKFADAMGLSGVATDAANLFYGIGGSS